jgi:Protein of unknown function (DUF3108)
LALAAACGLPVLAQRAPSRGARPKSAPVPAAPRAERAVPFRIGEVLTYDVSWSSYLTAGTVVASVREKKPSNNSTAYYIVAEARPTTLLSKLYTLYYKADTLLDSYDLLPQRGSIYSEEGSRHRYRTTRFDRRAQRAFFEYQTDHVIKADFAVSPVVQDVLSALYVLRAIPLVANDRMTMPVSDDGTNYRVQIDIGAIERIKTPLGELETWKLKPTIVDDRGQPIGRNFFIWISRDVRHLPVKVQGELPVGSFVLLLRDAR